MLALHGLAFGLGRMAAAEAEKRRWLQAVLAEQLSGEQLLAEQMRYSERMQIARELHDLMGHHLTALNLQLQLGGALLARADAAGASQALDRAQGVAAQLLADVREAVSQQRSSQRIDLSRRCRHWPRASRAPASSWRWTTPRATSAPRRARTAALRAGGRDQRRAPCSGTPRAVELHGEAMKSPSASTMMGGCAALACGPGGQWAVGHGRAHGRAGRADARDAHEPGVSNRAEMSTMGVIKILLVEDQQLVREGLKGLLALHDELRWWARPATAPRRWSGWRRPPQTTCPTSSCPTCACRAWTASA
jgi:hypothetical protein